MALLITPQGYMVTIIGEGERQELTLGQICRELQCHTVEGVLCNRDITGGFDIVYIDEEGKWKENQLINDKATELAHWISKDDFIVGNALFCVSDEDGNSY